MIAGALFIVASLKPELQDCYNCLSNIERIPTHQITQTAPASLERLQEICEATAKDSALRLLTDTVHEGWPKQSETVHAVYSCTGTLEMRSHVRMEFYTREQD